MPAVLIGRNISISRARRRASADACGCPTPPGLSFMFGAAWLKQQYRERLRSSTTTTMGTSTMSYWTDHVARIERNNAIRAKNQEKYGRDIAPPESFHNPLRKSWGAGPRIEKQTAQEMAAYCRVWGIIPQGSLLANTAEYRTGPHPDSY